MSTQTICDQCGEPATVSVRSEDLEERTLGYRIPGRPGRWTSTDLCDEHAREYRIPVPS